MYLSMFRKLKEFGWVEFVMLPITPIIAVWLMYQQL